MWAAPQRPDVSATTAFWWLQQTQSAARHASSPLPDTVLFLDVETTRNRIVEVAMVRLQRGFVPWVHHSYVDPANNGWMRSSTHWNTSIHGLTPRMVDGHPTFEQLAPIVRRAADGAVLIAHNVAFERRFLVQEFGTLAQPWRVPTLDTLAMARATLPDLDDHKLDSVAAALDVRNPAPHRALGDTVTTVWALLGLLERLDRPEAVRVLQQASRDGDGRRTNPWTR